MKLSQLKPLGGLIAGRRTIRKDMELLAGATVVTVEGIFSTLLTDEMRGLFKQVMQRQLDRIESEIVALGVEIDFDPMDEDPEIKMKTKPASETTGPQP